MADGYVVLELQKKKKIFKKYLNIALSLHLQKKSYKTFIYIKLLYI